jgi:hypothetical protein
MEITRRKTRHGAKVNNKLRKLTTGAITDHLKMFPKEPLGKTLPNVGLLRDKSFIVLTYTELGTYTSSFSSPQGRRASTADDKLTILSFCLLMLVSCLSYTPPLKMEAILLRNVVLSPSYTDLNPGPQHHKHTPWLENFKSNCVSILQGKAR